MRITRGHGSWIMAAVALVALVGAAAPVATVAADEARVVLAAHILVSPDDDPGGAQELDADDPAWLDAEVEAQAMATELRAIADPVARAARFAELARAHSDDTSSGAQGGELGTFTRDQMVPEFADPLFDATDLAVGDVLVPVRSDFGWHLILYEGEAEPSASPAAPTPAPTPGMTLLLPGDEPHILLRYALVEGTTSTVTLTSSTDSTVSLDDMDPIETHLETTMTWDAAVTDVTADGAARTELTLTEVELGDVSGVDAATEAAMRTQFDGMVGLSGWVLMDPMGRTIDSGVEIPDGLDPAMARAFEQSIATFSLAPAPFPEDPVGVGATWSSVLVTPSTDLATTTVTRVLSSITAIDGLQVTWHATTTASGEPGPISYPGMPEGASVVLMRSEGSSSATSTIDLAALRMELTMRSSVTTDLSVDYAGRTVPMTTVAITEMTISTQ